AWLSSPTGVRKGEPLRFQARSYSRPCESRTACTRALSVSGVLSVEKRKLKSISAVPGTTFVAPVPAWKLEIWNVVGGKYSLPSSQLEAASSATAAAHWWTGLRARCG